MIKCCLGCTDRVLGCHSSCERYKAEREALDAENKARFQHELVECTHHKNLLKYIMPTTAERKRNRHKV